MILLIQQILKFFCLNLIIKLNKLCINNACSNRFNEVFGLDRIVITPKETPAIALLIQCVQNKLRSIYDTHNWT